MMRQHEIKQHGVYTAKVSGHIVPLRVDFITKRPVYQYSRSKFKPPWGKNTMRTQYDCTNLVTGRTITVKSAQRFRNPVGPNIMAHLGLEPIDTAAPHPC